MSLLQTIEDRLKEAMKTKSQKELSVLRMVKSKLQLKRSEAGFSGEMTDAIVQEVIASYVKMLKNSIPEFEKAGDAAKEKLEQIQYETSYLAQFLPTLLSDDETRNLVQAKIQEMAVTDAKGIGKLMGAIMKDHKGKVDAAVVKRIASEILGG